MPLNSYDAAYAELGGDPSEGDQNFPISLPEKGPWPQLAPKALFGLAGDIVKTNDPFTESHQAHVLINFLTAFGNCIGSTAHFKVEHKKHFPRLFAILVGPSSVGRKGTSWATVGKLFEETDSAWAKDRIVPGLSSGEGLINEVRDEVKGIKNGEEQILDAGVQDKRLLVLEEEFSRVLKVMAREGNILSTILREAWDKGDLRTLTKNNPLRASGAHISILGHIGKDELLRYLNDTEQGNGFGNRFLWVLGKRSKVIPNPTGIPLSSLNSLISQVEERISSARNAGTMARDQETEKVWSEIYPYLSAERPGLLGSLLARGPVQVMRLACLYALLDKSQQIMLPHLNAALALWDYCEGSVKWIFGDSFGDPYADRVMKSLKDAYPDGLTETEIWNLFGKHGGPRIPQALSLLQSQNLIYSSQGTSTGGRPPTIWRVCEKSERSEKSPGGGL